LKAAGAETLRSMPRLRKQSGPARELQQPLALEEMKSSRLSSLIPMQILLPALFVAPA
jgi:hypothetical protein